MATAYCRVQHVLTYMVNITCIWAIDLYAKLSIIQNLNCIRLPSISIRVCRNLRNLKQKKCRTYCCLISDARMKHMHQPLQAHPWQMNCDNLQCDAPLLTMSFQLRPRTKLRFLRACSKLELLGSLPSTSARIANLFPWSTWGETSPPLLSVSRLTTKSWSTHLVITHDIVK